MKRTEFVAIYEEELTRANAERPAEYGFPPHRVPEIVEKMTKAIENGSANTDGLALRRVARKVGIKPTRRDITAFVLALEA
jgi:hypothetical protein